MNYKAYLYCGLILILSCDLPKINNANLKRFEHIKDKKAKFILQKSMQHYGGIKKWEAIQQLNYTKDFSLFSKEGEIEKSFSQNHSYRYHPLQITINSTTRDTVTQTILENGLYRQTKAGKATNKTQRSLEKGINTSLYVVGMPFKLLDEGAIITYEGEVPLEDGELVDVLKVVYNPDKYSNHSTMDTWKYYFDKKEGKIRQNWVDTGDHISLVENISFERVGGILWNKKRLSWRLDSLGNKDFLRAEYFYDNYKVDY